MNTIEIYQSRDKQTQVEVRFENESVWLSQAQMAKLFNQTRQNISLHINNCYNEEELSKKATVKESLTVQQEGRRQVARKIEAGHSIPLMGCTALQRVFSGRHCHQRKTASAEKSGNQNFPRWYPLR